jgi:hypothetical protein
MKLQSWSAKAIDDNCVDITISEDIDISDLSFSLFNETRSLIMKIKVTDRHFNVCSQNSRPTFVQLGDSVRYVEGSGYEAYEIKLAKQN